MLATGDRRRRHRTGGPGCRHGVVIYVLSPGACGLVGNKKWGQTNRTGCEWVFAPLDLPDAISISTRQWEALPMSLL